MEKLTLYHGSRSGLVGAIRPDSSRAVCDFGQGFYMGDSPAQPRTLICDERHPVLYTVKLNLDGLKVHRFEPDAEWAMFVAFNRGKLEKYRRRPFYRRYAEIRRNSDVIFGKIANDKMFTVLNLFFEGVVGVTALVHAMTSLNIGNQYCAVSPLACSHVEIVRAKSFSANELKLLRLRQENQRRTGAARAAQICRAERREGIGFDEVLQALLKEGEA